MKSLRISLKARERLYVNGAELRVDRRVSVEILNEARILLEGHVLRPEEARTPLRRLYCLIQSMMIGTSGGEETLRRVREAVLELACSLQDRAAADALGEIAASVEQGRHYEALRVLRGLFALEEAGLLPAPKSGMDQR